MPVTQRGGARVDIAGRGCWPGWSPGWEAGDEHSEADEVQRHDAVAPFVSSGDGSAFGLRAMRQRVAGRLEVENVPGEDTAVSASVPATGPERTP